jgi:hypothetical protein
MAGIQESSIEVLSPWLILREDRHLQFSHDALLQRVTAIEDGEVL